MGTREETATVRPAEHLGGSLSVPGDKSISHRCGMLCGLADGTSTVTGYLRAEDCLHTLEAMGNLGAQFQFGEDGLLKIQGTGGPVTQPSADLDVGNSGTTIRLLAGLLAGQDVTVVLTGDDSLRKRPMLRIKTPLEMMGATVELFGDDRCAPMRVKGSNLRGMEYPLPVASAQVKSCVLLAGLFAEGPTTVIEPRPTRDHTERLLQAMGVPLQIDGGWITLQGYGRKGPDLPARNWVVPGDFSSAAFLLLAVAAKPDCHVEITGVGLNPRRTAFLDVLKRMGADLSVTVESEDPEPWGRILLRGGRLQATEVGGDEIPNLIDELPLVAAAGALAEGRTVIRDAAELRVKESDRIATMAENLRRLGVQVEERPDGMEVSGPAALRAEGPLPSYGDHRVAMAMATLGLYAETPVTVEDVACVATSYPEFWTDLKRLGAYVES